MSAIGDYIHLYAKNYNKYGINKIEQGKSISATDAFAKQKALLNQKMNNNHSAITEEEKLTLRKQIAYLMSTENAKNDTQVQILQQKIIDKLQKQFQEKLGTINFNTGQVTAQSIISERNEVLRQIEYQDNQKFIFLKTIYNRIKIIQDMLDSITSQTKKEKLKQTLSQINTALIELCNTTEQSIDELVGINYKIYIQENNQNKVTSLVQDLNTIINSLISTLPINLERGTLFEYIIALCQGVEYEIVDDEIEEMLQQSVKGSEKFEITYDLNKFSKDFDPSLVKLNYTTKDKSGIISIIGSNSQGKVDVVIETRDNNTARVSAKNINLSNNFGIHVVSSSSLLYLIQNSNSDFINHYLNLAATHSQLNDQNINLQLLGQAREELKLTLLWEAVSGDTFGRENAMADTFIINDNSKTGIDSIQIYDIPDLVNKAATNLNIFVTITNGKTSIDDIIFTNIRSEISYKERLSKLLQEVYAQKITVALQPALFK